MKIFLVLMALVPFVRGQLKPSIGSQLRDSIEAFRDRMPCGFPEYGLPPMAPYETEHQEVAIDTESLQAYGEVNDFLLYGLNDFDIVDLRVQAIFSRLTFKLNWNNVHFLTNYNVTSARGGKGLRRYGPAKFSLKNVIVWGLVKYNLGLVSGKISVKELSVYVSLGEVKSEIDGLSGYRIINKKLNRVIEEWFMLAVNDNTNKVADITNDMVKPFVNDFLSTKTLGDLLAMAGGSGGTEEREPCIPPEDLD